MPTPAQVASFYDFTGNTQQQVLEVLNHVTSGFTEPYSVSDLQQIESNIEDVSGILMALEANSIHQLHLNDAAVKNWLYNELGITTTDS